MNFKKKVSGSWTDTPHYIHNTSTDTITTLPAVIHPTGTTATVGLKGQTVQSSIPSPTSPIMPQGTGERTGNLFDPSQPVTISNKYLLSDGTESSAASGWAVSTYIPVNGEYVTLSGVGGNAPSICAYDANKQFVRGKNYGGTNKTTISISGCSYVRLSYVPSVQGATAMLNTGSTALPYEPYGYKIPISSANTTTPVYLGEVQTTRRVKKLVLTGNETWTKFVVTGRISFYTNVPDGTGKTGLSSHFRYGATASFPDLASFSYNGDSNKNMIFRMSDDTSITEVADFKAWLAAQYAAGTPVTVWYVLATEETGIVNEPLRKIGNYADTVSGITIPTIAGADSFDVLTTLKPSEVELTYTGWHDATVQEWDGSQWNE